MRHTRSKVVSGLSLAGLAMMTLLSGCAEEEVSISIVQAQIVDPEECIPVVDLTQFRTRGVVDLSMAQNYVLYPLVQNNMPNLLEAQGLNQQSGRTNTNQVVLESADVRLFPQERISVNLPARRTVATSGTVNTNNGTAVIGLEVFTNDMLQALRNSEEFLGLGAQGEAVPLRNTIEFIVSVTVKGRSLAGADLETNEFRFPINVCNGCLVEVPNEAVDPDQPTPNCLRFVADLFNDSSVCADLVGQDIGVDCRVCKSRAATPLSQQLCEPSSL